MSELQDEYAKFIKLYKLPEYNNLITELQEIIPNKDQINKIFSIFDNKLYIYTNILLQSLSDIDKVKYIGKKINDNYNIIGLNIVYLIISSHITKNILIQKGITHGDEFSKIIRSQHKFDTNILNKINNLPKKLNEYWEYIDGWDSKIYKNIIKFPKTINFSLKH